MGLQLGWEFDDLGWGQLGGSAWLGLLAFGLSWLSDDIGGAQKGGSVSYYSSID